MIVKSLLSMVLLGALSIPVYAEQLSARNILEGSLDDDTPVQQQKFAGIEASVVLYDAYGNSTPHALNQALKSGQKFKLRLMSTVNGVIQVTAKNADGTEQQLPELYVKRGRTMDYPPAKNAVFELSQQKGQEELHLMLMPDHINPEQVFDKNILEGVIEEEDTAQASYIIAPANMPIIKRIILTHR